MQGRPKALSFNDFKLKDITMDNLQDNVPQRLHVKNQNKM